MGRFKDKVKDLFTDKKRKLPGEIYSDTVYWDKVSNTAWTSDTIGSKFDRHDIAIARLIDKCEEQGELLRVLIETHYPCQYRKLEKKCAMCNLKWRLNVDERTKLTDCVKCIERVAPPKKRKKP